jgi:hypothetical protein
VSTGQADSSRPAITGQTRSLQCIHFFLAIKVEFVFFSDGSENFLLPYSEAPLDTYLANQGALVTLSYIEFLGFFFHVIHQVTKALGNVCEAEEPLLPISCE